MTTQILPFPYNQDCLICGNPLCTQSYDHQKVTLEQMNHLLETQKRQNQSRIKLINQVNEFYDCFLDEIVRSIQKDRLEILQTLRRADYEFLNGNPKISMAIVGEIACQNYESLPSKRLIHIVQGFEGNTTFLHNKQKQTQNQIEAIINEYISVENFVKKVGEFKNTLFAPILNLQTELKSESSRKVSIRECENPELYTSTDDDPIQVTIKGKIITQKSVEAEVNNRNITDNDIVSSINELKKFKRLTKIEIRNNRITSLTSKLIAFNLPSLTKLDIRGNNLGDEGVLVLAQNLKNLTELYICENKVTDVVAEEIFKNLKGLTMLWMESNMISLGAATMIVGGLENLRAVSLSGNLFSQDEGQCLKTNFLGYMNV